MLKGFLQKWHIHSLVNGYTWILVAAILEVYAFFLAYLQMLHGVRTDEAKYLLDIPYPHPPATRAVLDFFADMAHHEFFVRLLIATLLVQSVWFLWPCVKRVAPGAELVVCSLWLASGGLVLQGGAIMISTLNAWQGLVLLGIALTPFAPRQARGDEKDLLYFFIALFWLWSLFTGYQAFLFAPLVLTIFRRSSLPLWQQILYVVTPIALLILYSFSNPLSLVRMVGTAEKDVGLTLMERTVAFGWLWWIAGGGLLSVIGTWGIFRSRRLDLIGVFLLLSSFIFLSNSPYYAILLTPLLLGGVLFLRGARQSLVSAVLLSIGVPVMLLINVASSPPLVRNVARDVGNILGSAGYNDGTALIVGPFGHEWQYYMPMYPVRYTETLEEAPYEVVICRHECPERLARGMMQLADQPVRIFGRL